MIILSIRTDNPKAEIGLFNDGSQLDYISWQAHRELAETIHKRIDQLLKDQQKTWQDIQGIVCFKGPGSFTGLRIGLTVANTIADSLSIPIVGDSGSDWVSSGIQKLQQGKDQHIVLPEYGGEPHITQQKK